MHQWLLFQMGSSVNPALCSYTSGCKGAEETSQEEVVWEVAMLPYRYICCLSLNAPTQLKHITELSCLLEGLISLLTYMVEACRLFIACFYCRASLPPVLSFHLHSKGLYVTCRGWALWLWQYGNKFWALGTEDGVMLHDGATCGCEEPRISITLKRMILL